MRDHDNNSSYGDSKILQNEAQGQPWLWSAIIEREMALDEIVGIGGMHYATEEQKQQFIHASETVTFRKLLLGLPEYVSDATDTII